MGVIKASRKDAVQNLGLVFGMLLAIILPMFTFLVQPVSAAGRVNINPSSITLAEGGSQEVKIKLDEPLLAESGDPYAVLEILSDNSAIAKASDTYLDFAFNNWFTEQTITISAPQNQKVTGTQTTQIKIHVYSNSEYYNDFETVIPVTVTDDDSPPAVTYPTTGKNIPAGSLTISGTAAPGLELGVKLDGQVVGTVNAGDDGTWILLVQNVKAGNHSAQVQTQTSHHYAYMANNFTGSIDVIDIDSQEYVNEITDTGSVGAIFNKYNGLVYSADVGGGNCRIVAYDPMTYEQVAVMTNGTSCNSRSIALSSDGKKAYMLYDVSGNDFYIMEANLTNNTRIGQTGYSDLHNKSPSGISVTPDGSELWVRTVDGIKIFNTSNHQLIQSISLNGDNGAYQNNIEFSKDGDWAYTSDSAAQQVYKINTNTKSVVASTDLDSGLNMVALTPDQTKLYAIATYPGSTIYELNATSLQLIDTFQTESGLPPESFAFTEDGKWIIGDNHGSGGIFFGTVDTAGGLFGLAYLSTISDSFTQGQIIATSDSGAAGGLGIMGADIDFSNVYSSADVQSVEATAGLIVSTFSNINVTDSFIATNNINDNQDNAVLSNYYDAEGEEPMYATENMYFDKGLHGDRDLINTIEPGSTYSLNIYDVNQNNSDPYYFFDSANEPMSNWGFDNIWQSNGTNRYPVHEPFTMMGHNLYVTRTTTSLTPRWTKDDDDTGGVNRWQQLKYKKDADVSAQYKTIDIPANINKKEISGLTPNTWYDVELDFSNSRGYQGGQGFVAKTAKVASTTTTTESTSGSNSNSTNQPSDEEKVTDQNSLIILNDYPEFENGTGKRIQLKVGQVIYFNVGDEQHSATIKEIGDGYIIITLASTPRDVKLMVGQTGKYDVTDDGNNDIEVTYHGVKDGKADLTFKALDQPEVMPKDQSILSEKSSWLLWAIFISLAFAIIITRRKPVKNVQQK